MDTIINPVGPFLVTVSGRTIYFLDPDPNEIIIEDMAHALSRISRWGGHTHPFWSVAAHSLLVSQLLPGPLKLAGLLHDGHEYILGDVPTPLKELLREYGPIAAGLDSAIEKKFNIFLHNPAIKIADTIALATERRDLRNNGEVWPIAEGAAPFHLIPVSIEITQRAFLKEFHHLINHGPWHDWNK
jgi:uncharacterized protein